MPILKKDTLPWSLRTSSRASSTEATSRAKIRRSWALTLSAAVLTKFFLGRPSGTWSHFFSFPALTRWAKLVRPFGADCCSSMLSASPNKPFSLLRKDRADSDAGLCHTCLGRLPLHFYSRPFLEQHQRSRVVEIGVAVFDRHVVNLFDSFEAGKLHAGFFRCFKRKADVFSHEAKREVGCEI